MLERNTLLSLIPAALSLGASACCHFETAPAAAAAPAPEPAKTADASSLGGRAGAPELNRGAAVAVLNKAAVGGSLGDLIGKQMDERAEKLRAALADARVERVGEGILVTFASGILFDVNAAELREEAKANITELAQFIEDPADTDVMVVGHSDATGEASYNQMLSEKRAKAVADFAATQGIGTERMKTSGQGDRAPVASNKTSEGRQKNRRVEVAIFANAMMKDMAEKMLAEDGEEEETMEPEVETPPGAPS